MSSAVFISFSCLRLPPPKPIQSSICFHEQDDQSAVENNISGSCGYEQDSSALTQQFSEYRRLRVPHSAVTTSDIIAFRSAGSQGVRLGDPLADITIERGGDFLLPFDGTVQILRLIVEWPGYDTTMASIVITENFDRLALYHLVSSMLCDLIAKLNTMPQQSKRRHARWTMHNGAVRPEQVWLIALAQVSAIDHPYSDGWLAILELEH